MARFTFVRHGNDNKAAVDDQRLLTPTGQAQALSFRAKVEELKLSPFDVVISSPKARTKQTANIIAPDVDLVEALELSVDVPGADGTLLNTTYAELKYAPLGMYFAKPGVAEVMHRYAQAAWLAITANTPKSATSVLVVGHAVLLNAIGVFLSEHHALNKALLLSTSLGECEGFYLKEYGAEIITNP